MSSWSWTRCGSSGGGNAAAAPCSCDLTRAVATARIASAPSIRPRNADISRPSSVKCIVGQFRCLVVCDHNVVNCSHINRRAIVQTVGVRELKARLSECLKRVHGGERLTVTDRGRAVAVITPVNSAPALDGVHEMIVAGRARWGGGKPVG